MPKVTIIGAGNVGASAAELIARFAHVVLVDIAPGFAQGKALDMMQAAAIENRPASIIGTATYDETEGSDVIVVTAGIPRSHDQTREDTLATNARIVRAVVREAAQQSPDAVLIIVSNPLDAMCHIALKESGFPRERVIGMAGALDSGRFCANIAQACDVDPSSVACMVLGSHSDMMVPIVSTALVEKKPLAAVLPAGMIADIVERTRHGGAQIVNLLKTGSAYYAPGAGIARMTQAIVTGTADTLPCAVLAQGEYGISGVFLGLPTRLGTAGIEEVLTPELSTEELEALKASAAFVQDLVSSLP